MRHKIAVLITALFVMTGMLVGGTMAPATADSQSETPTCQGQDVTTGTGECADVDDGESHSRSASSSKAVSVNGVKIDSRVTVLANIRANGTPKAQQTNCFRTQRAMSLWTSYNAEGTTGWHWKYYPAGYRFCRINGAVRDPLCHNQVKIGVPKSNPPRNAIYGKVKFVKRLKWEATAVAKADEKVTAVAKAWCTSASSYAYGEGHSSAVAYAVGRARLRGYSLTKLLAEVKAQAVGDLTAQLGGQSITQVRGQVRSTAFAKAVSEASAKAVCSDTPPADQPPTYLQFREFNDLEVNWTSDHCVTVDFPEGHSGTVFWTAKYGSFAVPQKVANDAVQVCSTYKAPSEVPASGTDVITVTATDSTTGLSVSQSTDPFVIHPTASHPG